jgi:hypothetical protein
MVFTEEGHQNTEHGPKAEYTDGIPHPFIGPLILQLCIRGGSTGQTQEDTDSEQNRAFPSSLPWTVISFCPFLKVPEYTHLDHQRLLALALIGAGFAEGARLKRRHWPQRHLFKVQQIKTKVL